jgi:hypothetical protein
MGENKQYLIKRLRRKDENILSSRVRHHVVFESFAGNRAITFGKDGWVRIEKKN